MNNYDDDDAVPSMDWKTEEQGIFFNEGKCISSKIPYVPNQSCKMVSKKILFLIIYDGTQNLR